LYSVLPADRSFVPYNNEIVQHWEGTSPLEVVIQSSDKALDGLTFDFCIECKINLAANPNTIINEFTITMYDECYDTVVSPAPIRGSYEVGLFTLDSRPFSFAGQSKPCAPIEYELVFIDTTAAVPADFHLVYDNINGVEGYIEVLPDSLDNLGLYEFRILACVYY